ncbi:MAG: hypothetical protein JWM73_1837, partial [Solirubrobacterales bacterium]|nr:hypothetical protein [Solirubrobacterales bacterium]
MSELFNGVWRIDLDRSTVWDDQAQKHVPDLVGEEIITLDTRDGVQDYEVLYGDAPRITMGYASRLDDPAWTPYLVRAIEESEAPGGTVDEFKARINAAQGTSERTFVVGQPYGMVRTVYVDELTHYRLAKDPRTDKAQYVMMRRLAEDGESYVATVLDINGICFRIR